MIVHILIQHCEQYGVYYEHKFCDITLGLTLVKDNVS